MKTVLVTGVGAIIGYGILRSLRKSNQTVRLIAADIYPDAVGQAWADQFIIAPLTSSPKYLEWIKKVIADNNIDLVMPGIEQDLYFFSKHREIFNTLSTELVLNDQRLSELTIDKWLMHQELVSLNSEARIPSFLEGDFDSLAQTLGLPFLLKPRVGYASKGLVRIHSQTDFSRHAKNLGHELMAQPIVGTDDEEYTVAVFGDGTGQAPASITLRRRLAADGSTAKAWVEQHDGLDEVVKSLCAHFKPVGPTNLQFRKDENSWKLLEINPRISSTTSLRTAFGYNEAEMCLDYYLHGLKITQPVIKKGFAARAVTTH